MSALREASRQRILLAWTSRFALQHRGRAPSAQDKGSLAKPLFVDYQTLTQHALPGAKQTSSIPTTTT